MKHIIVVEYDPTWPVLFEQLRDRISTAIGEVAVSIEHVGSTAVPGLSAKPIIDMDVVVPDSAGVTKAIEGLATLGYKHRGNLGVEGREAFDNPPASSAHHLYICQDGNLALKNHLAIRDYLRSNPGTAQRYGELKHKLARQYPNDIDGYIDGKTDFLMNILSACGLTKAELDMIAEPNRLEESESAQKEKR